MSARPTMDPLYSLMKMEEKSKKNQKTKKTPKRDWGHTSFYISDYYKETHNHLKKLFEIDKHTNEDFIRYCNLEKINPLKYGRSLFGVYQRFINTQHVIKNLTKLREANKKNEN